MGDIFGWITSLMLVLDIPWAIHIMMGGFCLLPIWFLIGSHWSLRSLHFKTLWSANSEIWFWRMVTLIGGVPGCGEEGGIHRWLSGCDDEKGARDLPANLWYWAAGGLAALVTLEGVWPSLVLADLWYRAVGGLAALVTLEIFWPSLGKHSS